MDEFAISKSSYGKNVILYFSFNRKRFVGSAIIRGQIYLLRYQVNSKLVIQYNASNIVYTSKFLIYTTKQYMIKNWILPTLF